jgi:hypothetical protein
MAALRWLHSTRKEGKTCGRDLTAGMVEHVGEGVAPGADHTPATTESRTWVQGTRGESCARSCVRGGGLHPATQRKGSTCGTTGGRGRRGGHYVGGAYVEEGPPSTTDSGGEWTPGEGGALGERRARSGWVAARPPNAAAGEGGRVVAAAEQGRGGSGEQGRWGRKVAPAAKEVAALAA